MIGTLFKFGNEIVEVRVNDTNCLFRTVGSNGMFATIDNIKINKAGSIKEFPDLKNREDWKEETIKRFKDKIKNLSNEKDRMKYIINDLKKYGYVAFNMQQSGHRPVKIKA